MGALWGREVVVAGGGIAGLATALACAQRGARVRLFERAPEIREFGAGLQITPNGGAVLRALGLADAARDAGVRAQAVEAWDALSGRRLAAFALTHLPGEPYRFFHRADLIGLLARAAEAAGVQIETGRMVGAIGADGRVEADGTLRPWLAVGAEGLHSRLRETLNPGSRPFFTGQVAWRSVVEMAAPPAARIWMAPGRHVVTYPLPGGRLNLVAVEETPEWRDEGWHHPADPAALRQVFGGVAPALTDVLARVQTVHRWGLFRHPVAPVWHGSAAALVGDAAHPTLPFLAQGANLALEDAWTLAAAADAGPDLPAALDRWAATRRPRAARAIAAANANARSYHLGGLPRRGAQAALWLIGRLAPGAFLGRYDWLYRHDVTAGPDFS